MIDLYEAPLDFVHELFRHCLLKTIADAKEEERKRLEEERNSKIPPHLRKQQNALPQNESSGVSMDELEELFEEEM